MRRLLLTMILLFYFPAGAVPVPLTQANLKAVVMSQASFHNVPPLLLIEVCKKESALTWDARGLDDAARGKLVSARTEADYSYGICQVKIKTAQWIWSTLMPVGLRRDHVNTWDLYNPEFGAETAAIYMEWLHARYDDWELALVAYNRGHSKKPGESWAAHVRRLRWFTRNKPRDSQGNLLEPYYAVTIYQRWQSIQRGADIHGVVSVDLLYELHEMVLHGKVREPFYWQDQLLVR